MTLLQYGIVMDAGSSHTSLFIYRWDSERVGHTGLVEEMSECEAPGKLLLSVLTCTYVPVRMYLYVRRRVYLIL